MTTAHPLLPTTTFTLTHTLPDQGFRRQVTTPSPSGKGPG